MIEVERRFIVKDDSWMNAIDTESSVVIDQGYLMEENGNIVRVRMMQGIANPDNYQSFLTIKGQRVSGMNKEFEYEIPHDDAEQLMGMCKYQIHKRRHYIKCADEKLTDDSNLKFNGLKWEIDEFNLINGGKLVIAEIELLNIGQRIEFPDWLGLEITMTNDYSNFNLAKNRLIAGEGND